MRSDGFLLLSGGSGGGTVFVPNLEMISRAFAHVRARSFCARCAVPLGGLVVGVSCPMRCAIVIRGGIVVWVALCRWDWQGERCVGGTVPL